MPTPQAITDMNVAVIADANPPTVPTGLSGVPLSQSAARLTWNPSTHPRGLPVSYGVYRNGAFLATVSVTGYTDNGPLTASTVYTYEVRAVTVPGNMSGPASTVVTTLAATNHDPVWAGGAAAYDLPAMQVGVAFSLNLDTICSDPDGDTINYGQVSSSLPGGLAQSGSRGEIISGTPTTSQSGSFVLYADDGAGIVVPAWENSPVL